MSSHHIGLRPMQHLEDNLGVVDVGFTDEELDHIDEIVLPGTVASPFVEADFDSHVDRWKRWKTQWAGKSSSIRCSGRRRG